MDAEYWYFEARKRALSDVGVHITKKQYVHDMILGVGIWARAKADIIGIGLIMIYLASLNLKI